MRSSVQLAEAASTHHADENCRGRKDLEDQIRHLESQPYVEKSLEGVRQGRRQISGRSAAVSIVRRRSSWICYRSRKREDLAMLSPKIMVCSIGVLMLATADVQASWRHHRCCCYYTYQDCCQSAPTCCAPPSCCAPSCGAPSCTDAVGGMDGATDSTTSTVPDAPTWSDSEVTNVKGLLKQCGITDADCNKLVEDAKAAKDDPKNFGEMVKEIDPSFRGDKAKDLIKGYLNDLKKVQTPGPPEANARQLPKKTSVAANSSKHEVSANSRVREVSKAPGVDAPASSQTLHFILRPVTQSVVQR
jgi:hypothetical protein